MAVNMIQMQPHPNHNRTCQAHQDKRPEVRLGNIKARSVINPNARQSTPPKSQAKCLKRDKIFIHPSESEGGDGGGEVFGNFFFDLATDDTCFYEFVSWVNLSREPIGFQEIIGIGCTVAIAKH
jgi:hypothetical protein